MPNFNSQNEGTWFWFDDTNQEAGGVCLRELSPEEGEHIDKLTVKHKKKPIRGVLTDTTQTNTLMASRLTWDYCIVDWKNVQLDGMDVECSADNKFKMMRCLEFAKFIGECITELVETNKALEEIRLKNSRSSLNGNLASHPVKPVIVSTESEISNHHVNNAT